jgi:hypothetical protein
MTVEQQFAEGDFVATRWTARGTHEGELIGIQPTGKQVTVSGRTTSHSPVARSSKSSRSGITSECCSSSARFPR